MQLYVLSQYKFASQVYNILDSAFHGMEAQCLTIFFNWQKYNICVPSAQILLKIYFQSNWACMFKLVFEWGAGSP
jgi:hypothetical protein